MKKLRPEELRRKADRIRKEVVDVCVKNGAGHIAPSLSSVDILTALYYSVMDLAGDPEWGSRDRLVFSKAHGCYALYAILADIGYLAKRDWRGFYRDSFLAGCVERSVEHGIEAGCGSLGHGLPQAVGIAFGAKLQGKKYRTYCVVGDGEMQEGSNWEAVQFAVKHKLSGLTVIIDDNKLQAMDFLKNVLTPEDRENDLKIKLAAFGFAVAQCDGHKPEKIARLLAARKRKAGLDGRPFALIARTVKGYGLKCMENVPKFHFRLPTADEIKMGKRYEG